MSDQEWKRYNGGRRWRVLASGQIEIERSGIITSGGAPLTAQAFLLEHGDHAHEASRRYQIPVPWIVGMAAIEALRLKDAPQGMAWGADKVKRFLDLALPDLAWRRLVPRGFDPRGRLNKYRMDPVSLRKEDGYVSPEDTPGRVSAGLMQTLLTTARQMAHDDPRLRPLDGEGRARQVQLGDLLDPRSSILLGAAYMRDRCDHDDGLRRLGADFVGMTGSYNAGALRSVPLSDNPYGIQTYSPGRTDKGIRYHNDCFLPGARELIEPWALSYPAIPPRT